MSNSARFAVLETTILNINTVLLDIKQEIKFLSAKIERTDEKMESKFETLDKKIDSKIEALDKKIDTKIDALDKKIETKIDALDKKISSVQERQWSNFAWLMSMIIGLAGLIAHTQHWF